ncbi:hypothetical protein IDJ77_22270 [Mucilaginibacter sp. ZT4R22]|uniref:Uncharacterized protein n=1 Tax=Mucilaginibacter pankratovii TaxID=2772110 RepID=A0ABR7WW91_9SPHI|nr:hypothetical protein [Mucilaginibacter pankratovii]MBD1366556.1 hypothetical protein [Mucilaginibacter pankratovii]
MNENVLKITREMLAGGLFGREQEEKEYMVLQELCGAENYEDLTLLLDALGASGTVLAVPALLGQRNTCNDETKVLTDIAIDLIKARAKTRGSILPAEYFKTGHWKPRWNGSTNTFLSYVQVIADIYIKIGHDESEVNRIGAILAEEMEIDLSPYPTFADFKICQSDSDFEKDYRVVLDKMAQEQLLADAEEAGISKSDTSFLTGTLMDLQCDYLVARLKLKGNLEYYRFVLKITECLNQQEL